MKPIDQTKQIASSKRTETDDFSFPADKTISPHLAE
jgi:hypothetical protein